MSEHHSPLLGRYLRLTIVHTDPEDPDDPVSERTRRRRLRAVRDAVDRWWIRTIDTDDTATLDLRPDVDLDILTEALADNVPVTWPVTLTRAG